MKKRRSVGLVSLVLLLICLCSCELGEFGFGKTITALDGQVIDEPDYVDYTVSRILYGELTPLQQQAYRLIYNSVFSHEAKIQIPKINQSELTQVMLALRGDNPHMLCLDRTYTYYDTARSCYVIPEYIGTLEECEVITKELFAKAREIVSSVPENADDFIKEVYLHNALCVGCSYSEGSRSDSAYGALVRGSALCEGYTMAFKLLLDMAGVTSTVIRGEAENTRGSRDSHIWNIVRLGAYWYFTDVTWDDPVTNMDVGHIRHSYFNIGEEELSLTHSGYALPKGMAVSGGKYDYYLHTGLYCREDNWRDIISEKVGEAVELNGAHLEFKFDSDALFSYALEELFSNGVLQSIVSSCISTESFLCSYSTDKDVRVLHIYLSFQ